MHYHNYSCFANALVYDLIGSYYIGKVTMTTHDTQSKSVIE